MKPFFLTSQPIVSKALQCLFHLIVIVDHAPVPAGINVEHLFLTSPYSPKNRCLFSHVVVLLEMNRKDWYLKAQYPKIRIWQNEVYILSKRFSCSFTELWLWGSAADEAFRDRVVWSGCPTTDLWPWGIRTCPDDCSMPTRPPLLCQKQR